jgi:Secretion system C-terminal sorting domain/Beta-propeller repeat
MNCMKTLKYFVCLLVLLFLLFYHSNAQSPNFLWAKAIGGINDDFGYSVCIDDFGNIYTTGRFHGTVDFDPGVGIFNLTSTGVFEDIYILKLDSSGNFLWAKCMEGTVLGQGYSITCEAGRNVYIAGSFLGVVDFDPGVGVFSLSSTSAPGVDIFISKFDNAGNFLWAVKIGGLANDIAYSCNIDIFSNVYISGEYIGTVDFDPGSGVYNLTSDSAGVFKNAFILKLNSSGNFVWAKSIGGEKLDVSNSIFIDSSNNVYTTGYFQDTADFDPDSIGINNLIAVGDKDIFICKLNALGDFEWARAMSGTHDAYGQSIFVDAYSNVYSTGVFDGTVDFDPGVSTFIKTSTGYFDAYILKLDHFGNFKWVKTMGGTGFDEGLSISLDFSGNVYSTGFFQGIVDFDPDTGTYNLNGGVSTDIFISKLDSSGNFIWAKSMGGSINDQGESIALDALGNPIITGSFNSYTVLFGSTMLTNSDNTGNTYDIFVAKLDNGITAIESIKNNNEIKVYPNPSFGYLTIENTEKKNLIEVAISDITGKMVFTSLVGQLKFVINTENISEGIYFIHIKSDDFVDTRKIIFSR